MLISSASCPIWKAHWRFATFISWPHFLLLNGAIWSAGLAWLFALGLQALGIHGFLVGCGVVAVFVAVLGTLLKYQEDIARIQGGEGHKVLSEVKAELLAAG